MTKKANKSPLRYPGGKTRACKVLHAILKEHAPMDQFDTLVSPFFGGGSFEFVLQHMYGYKLCINDKFTPLFHFWKQAKDDKHALCEALRKVSVITKDGFAECRNTIMTIKDDQLQQAIQYFILNRCSFSGSTLSGGFSKESSEKRFTSSSIDKIEALDLNNVNMYNEDFQPFLESHGCGASVLIFLDPPYYLQKKSKLYGYSGDLHEQFDHQRLFDVVSSKKNWIMTYNDCDFIRELYKDFLIIEADWSYGMNKSKASSELVILSF